MLFRTETFGADTGIVSVLDATVRVKVRPSGRVNAAETEAWFTICCGEGSELTTTENTTVVVPP